MVSRTHRCNSEGFLYRSFRQTTLALTLTLTAMHSQAAIHSVGAGSYADAPNPDSYRCTIDYGYWIYNAGIVEPAIAGCDTALGPIGEPTKLYPHLTGPAANKPTGTHRWWGSVSFYGEMPIADSSKAGYITPDPITARISERGVRLLSIPAGLAYSNGNSDIYQIPDPFTEVFDGLAVGNTSYAQMDAKLYDYSDGAMTVEWQSGGTSIMRATFVHGSPYVYFDVLKGQLELRTKAANGNEKGVYYHQGNSLGLWTEVAGNRATFLITGDGQTQYHNTDSAAIRIQNTTGRMTIALLPIGSDLPDSAMISRYQRYALNRVDELRVDYHVDATTQAVTITRQYLNNGGPVETIAGLQPLHWKHATSAINSTDRIRSARGYTKFAPLSSFSYRLPFVGVLPTMPALTDAYDTAKLRSLIEDFVAQGEHNWNTQTDTYWAGKNYGKVAELAALAHSHGWTDLHARLVNWLKTELEDWFTANSAGRADTSKYFSYNDQWNTLLGFDESFGAHQQLNDHHFHYGYFVRAAAEICRTDKSWCQPENYGGMVEMLIRDYAANRNDALFPYTRNFDPANGFSWASGHANFALGNNNESTSEAANAYGAIILYGLITGNDTLTKHGIYLHTSSTATYWEYWNNIDRYRGLGAPYDNFSPDYDKMTTSIIWGNGHVFSTWFSAAYAHILGIQGLPLNPLVMHIGQHPDYLADYVRLGLSESSNGKPSGLANDNWRDVWWNIWAMTDSAAAIADFNTMNFSYDIEAGETMAHTYQWIHAFNALGHLRSGTGEITADSPTALVFTKNGHQTYVAYNYSDSANLVRFSDGMTASVPANSFSIKRTGDAPDDMTDDRQAPTAPTNLKLENLGANSATLTWTAATDNVAVTQYRISVQGPVNQSLSTPASRLQLTGLSAETAYQVTVVAVDSAGNVSASAAIRFTTAATSADNCTAYCVTEQGDQLVFTVKTGAYADLHYVVNQGTQQNVRMTTNNAEHQYTVGNLSSGDVVKYYFTIVDGLAEDTAWQTHTVGSAGNDNSGGNDSNDQSCTDICTTKIDSDSLRVRVVTSGYSDLHYLVNQGTQMNVRMIADGDSHYLDIDGLKSGDQIDYFITVIDGLAYDTPWARVIF